MYFVVDVLKVNSIYQFFVNSIRMIEKNVDVTKRCNYISFKLMYILLNRFKAYFICDCSADIKLQFISFHFSISIKGQMLGVQSKILLLKMSSEAWAANASQRGNIAWRESTKMRLVQWTWVVEFHITERFSIHFASVRVPLAIALPKVSNGTVISHLFSACFFFSFPFNCLFEWWSE